MRSRWSSSTRSPELLANECAGAFGMAKDAAMREDAEARLRILTRQQSRRLLGTDRIFRAGARRAGVWRRLIGEVELLRLSDKSMRILLTNRMVGQSL